MNGDLLKLMVGGVVGAHGIGHVMGGLPAWGIAKIEGASSRSWLLTNFIGDGSSRAIGGVIWFVATAGFIAAAGGLFAGQSWWRPVAVLSAAVSLAAVALFWDALPLGSRVGCIAVDVAVVVALVVAAWPSAATVGA